MEQAVVKILLLGICGYGSNYIKEISERDIPGIKIEGICEVVPNAADLYPIIKEQNIPIYQTPEDFYKEHTADLAVVSTPIHLHYSQIVTCLTHGSNVLTEKPVCTSVEGARKLEQLEKETGKFISVGYQLNYSRDVLALKQDILDGRFGKPIYMKALHAMRRGDKYYARNSWAGHIDVKGCAVNDSPFNNACAHQFQVMTFLLGERLERAAELADVHYSEFARKYLADTGLPKERTYQTGSPMAEVLHMNLEKIQKSDVLERLGLEKDKYILLSAHREENIDSEKNFLSLFTAINALAEKYDMPILYSCHPRSRHRLEKSGFQLDPRVRVNEPLGFNDYNRLQMNALAIVSDSGTLPEESSFYLSIGHPIAAVCIRTSTERPEALEAGDFILAGITTRELLNATDMAIEMKQKGVLGKPCPDYVDETVSMKVVRIIQGYVNVVNKMVWRKI